MKIGKVRYLSQFARDESFCEVFGALKFVPINVEHDDMFDDYIATGLSPLFDDVIEGDPIPEYLLTMNQPAREPGKHAPKPVFGGVMRIDPDATPRYPWEPDLGDANAK